jgi:Flp pilus assembly CpaE family ATPase
VLTLVVTMELTVRKSQVPAVPGASEASGPVYAIVPAHGGSNADLVAKQLSRELSEGYRLSVLLADFCPHGFPLWSAAEAPQRLDGRTWGAFVTPGDVFDTLEARDANPRHISRLLDHARTRYQITCADLSEAKESAALEVLRHADSIFLVANSDRQSVEQARYRTAWLRSMDLEDRTALLLNRVNGGASGAEVEDRTGLPVCATVDRSRDLRRLAEWLAAPLLADHGPDYGGQSYSEPVLRAG